MYELYYVANNVLNFFGKEGIVHFENDEICFAVPLFRPQTVDGWMDRWKVSERIVMDNMIIPLP
jgi:hypothetical protein